MTLQANPLVNTARRWVFRLVAVLLPISEPAAQLGAVAALLFFGLERPATRETTADRLSRRAAWLVVAGLVGWTVVALIGCWTTGFAPRLSRLNKIYMAGAIAAGAVLLPRTDSAELKLLVRLLVVGSAVAAAVGLWQFFIGPFPGETLLTGDRAWMGQLYIPGTRQRAGTGTLLNRLKMAEALLFIASVAIACLIAASTPQKRRLWAVVLLGLVAALVLTFTKSSLPTLVMAAAALWMLRRWAFVRRYLPGLIGLGLVVGMGVSILGAVSFPEQPRIPTESSIAERRWLWQRGLDTLGSAPWFGVGAAAYEKGSRPFIVDGADAFYSGAHNQHLTQLAEGGVIGFVFWTMVWVGILAALWRRWNLEPRSPEGAVLRDVGTLYVLTLMPMMFVHDVLFHPGTAAMFWLAVGCLLVPAAVESSDAPTHEMTAAA